MSEFARIGIVTILFVVLLSIGSAVGISFYFKTLPQPAKSALNHPSPTLARSDKTDSVFDVRRRLGLDGRGRPNDRTVTAEPANAHDPEPSALPAGAEPNFEPPAAPEEIMPAQTDSIATPAAEPESPGAAEPESTSTASPRIRQRAPSDTAGLGTATPSKAARRRPAPCRSETCRQALAQCSKLCDAAMTLSVAACPKVSSGASEKDEKACLAKWDRRRRDCYSGCALKQTGALKAP
jgi:hypothetical protein